jgi:hypothetical protein
MKGNVLKTIEMMDEHRFLANPILRIYVDEPTRWGGIPCQSLNDAARKLYGESLEKLAKSTEVSEVI